MRKPGASRSGREFAALLVLPILGWTTGKSSFTSAVPANMPSTNPDTAPPAARHQESQMARDLTAALPFDDA
jgi:undecaprenyl pyrophosphate phosphatase UppP